MKLLYLLILFPLLNCSGQSNLKIETIITKPTRITSQDLETGKTFERSTYIPITKRLEPTILIQDKSENNLTFLLQGNINSAGLSINKIKKIRFEKSELIDETITLKYFAEIEYIAGKEGANVQGYNYTKQEMYKIPRGIKKINIELYEDRIIQRAGSKHPKLKLVAQQIFDINDVII
ncbi:hypothetical protein [Empedobacter tilapiae]